MASSGKGPQHAQIDGDSGNYITAFTDFYMYSPYSGYFVLAITLLLLYCTIYKGNNDLKLIA
jgi:hypothetical protein